MSDAQLRMRCLGLPTIEAMNVDEYMALGDVERESRIEALDGASLLQLGVDLYNAGHYWHAHEAWEAVWLDAPQELRAFYQGLIQVTAAFVHVVRNEYPGSVRLLAEGIDKLQRYGASFRGIDLEALVEGTTSARERLEALGARRIGEFDRGLIPAIRWVSGEEASR